MNFSKILGFLNLIALIIDKFRINSYKNEIYENLEKII